MKHVHQILDYESKPQFTHHNLGHIASTAVGEDCRSDWYFGATEQQLALGKETRNNHNHECVSHATCSLHQVMEDAA